MNRVFSFTASSPEARIELKQLSGENGIDLYRFTLEYPTPRQPEPIRIDWEEDMVNILHVWHPTNCGNRFMHQWFAASQNRSFFCEGAPVLCTIGASGSNSETISVSDVCTPITISYCIKDLDQQDKVGYAVEFFSRPSDPIQTYTADIRIDRRSLPFYETIMSVSPWWEEYGHVIPPCPATAEDPLYSSWYNFHQAPESKKLLKDLEIAADLGFRTVILDDGWQFEGPSTGNYANCGEWTVAADKFPDFKAFTDSVHKLGMKLMVWFTVPFIGVDSPACARFAGKYLYYSEPNKCYILDPRFPEVRSFLVETYSDFLRKYDIDGFKLDFIDSFQPGDLAREFCGEMDFPTVGEAVRKLLVDITGELARIKPDLLYEYRQFYVGPAINLFGNMLRVCDCAYESLFNRVAIADLRLMNYPIAIHSDMLFWSNKESVTLCAKQLLNILFAVPQISVILADSTQAQKDLLKYYIRYWTENREILLHGAFRPLHPELNYTSISAENDEKEITVLYADQPYTYHGKACDLFHNGDLEGLLVENPTNRLVQAKIFDNMGNLLSISCIPANTILRLPVPPTGMARISE